VSSIRIGEWHKLGEIRSDGGVFGVARIRDFTRSECGEARATSAASREEGGFENWEVWLAQDSCARARAGAADLCGPGARRAVAVRTRPAKKRSPKPLALFRQRGARPGTRGPLGLLAVVDDPGSGQSGVAQRVRRRAVAAVGNGCAALKKVRRAMIAGDRVAPAFRRRNHRRKPVANFIPRLHAGFLRAGHRVLNQNKFGLAAGQRNAACTFAPAECRTERVRGAAFTPRLFPLYRR